MTRRARRMGRWIGGGLALLVILALGGPVLYNNVLAPPAPAMLDLPAAPSHARMAGGATRLAGLWHAGTQSIAGFRVPTDALGYQQTVVGRTRQIQGSVAIVGTVVATASFTVDVYSTKTSASAHTLMDVRAYPTARFVLRRPMHLDGLLASGTIRRYAATGELTLHGATRPVSLAVSAELRGRTLYVLADVPIVLSDWHIKAPFGVENHGTIEVLLGLTQGQRGV